MRREWEMATRDLREASGISERARFDKAMTQLQKALKIIPTEVLYEPTFTYIWSIPEARFPEQLKQNMDREEALKEIARSYLVGAGMTLRGELARVTGLRSPEAGLGNWGLVDEGFAERLAPGVYRLTNLTAHIARVASWHLSLFETCGLEGRPYVVMVLIGSRQRSLRAVPAAPTRQSPAPAATDPGSFPSRCIIRSVSPCVSFRLAVASIICKRVFALARCSFACCRRCSSLSWSAASSFCKRFRFRRTHGAGTVDLPFHAQHFSLRSRNNAGSS